MPAQLETHRASALYEFEESIRMDCLTLNEAIDLLRSSDSTFFVVGKGIKEYLPLLRSLGAHDLWKVEENDLHTLQKLYKKYPKKYRDNPHLMYAYIDYVLLHSDAHLLIFLPEKNGILEDGFWAGPTYDEIKQTLRRFSTYYERIHFVNGLFSQPPVTI